MFGERLILLKKSIFAEDSTGYLFNVLRFVRPTFNRDAVAMMKVIALIDCSKSYSLSFVRELQCPSMNSGPDILLNSQFISQTT